MSTPTEAHLKLAKQMGVTCGNEYAAQILRESEARAVEAISAEKCDLQNKVDNFDANWEQQQIIVRRLRERVCVLEEALQAIVGAQPCTHEGGCFYPMRDGDGEYIGEQNVDPLSVIGGMVQTAQEALATPERKEGEQ